MNNQDNWQKKLDKQMDKEFSPNTRVLARALSENDIAIVEKALHVEENLDKIGLQEVPKSLQSKLAEITQININKEVQGNVVNLEKKQSWYVPLALAASIAMVMIVGNSLINFPTVPNEPTLAEVKQAQKELAIAFEYISIAQHKSRTQLNHSLQNNIQRPVIKSLVQPLIQIKES